MMPELGGLGCCELSRVYIAGYALIWLVGVILSGGLRFLFALRGDGMVWLGLC